MANHDEEITGWVGWITFAGVMMLLVAVFHFIIGLTALFNSHWFVSTAQSTYLLNITGWGWVQVLLGAAIGLAGLSLFSGNMGGRVVAVLLAGLSAIANLGFLSTYPLWSLVVITIDVLIMYAVTVHGSEMRVYQ